MDANVIAKLIEKTGKVDRSRALYVGYSRQPSVQSEALSFMTSRGKGKKLPVLTWPDGSIITQQAAETQLDFKISVVYRSSMMGNATAVEAALQRLYHDDLELGHRLWRHVGMGAKHDPTLDGLDHKVFVTYSAKVLQLIEERRIVVNK